MSHGWYSKLYLSIGASRGQDKSRKLKKKTTDGSLAHTQQQKREEPAPKIQKAKAKKKWEREVFLEVYWGSFKCFLDLERGMKISKAVHQSEPMVKLTTLCLSY